MVYHAAGWLEGGLCASYEKFVMDCETLQQMIAYNKPIGTTEDDTGQPGIGLLLSADYGTNAEKTAELFAAASNPNTCIRPNQRVSNLSPMPQAKSRTAPIDCPESS